MYRNDARKRRRKTRHHQHRTVIKSDEIDEDITDLTQAQELIKKIKNDIRN